MKRTFLLLVCLFFIGYTYSQTVVDLYDNDFDAYTSGDYLGVVDPDNWEPWGGTPGAADDAMVTDAEANTAPNSFVVDEVGGATDAIWKLGNKTAGVYMAGWNMYVQSGFEGYYNFQKTEAPGTEWAFEIYFRTDGSIEFQIDQVTVASGTYTPDTWFNVDHLIDLDNDVAEIYIEGTMLHTWTWSNSGLLQLGGVDFYAGTNVAYYVDDVNFDQVLEPIYCDDFEAFTAGEYIAEQDPVNWATWGNAPGTPEDGMISDAQAYSGANSVLCEGAGGLTDLILKLGDKTNGKYEVDMMMYVPAGAAAYYNFQKTEAPGTEWAFEIYFATDGTADFQIDQTSMATFNYTQDAWFMLHHVIDLDTDVAEMYYEGTLIHTWTWSNSGLLQLGGIDFFTSDDTYTFYIDDVCYQQTGGASDPIIAVDPTAFEQEEGTGTMGTAPMEVANIGGADLEYMIAVIYDIPTKKQAIVNVESSMIYSKGNVQHAAIQTGKPGGYPPPTDDVILNYDGPNSGTAVGLTGPGEWRGAAKFPASMVNEYAGMELSTVRIYVNELKPADEIAIRVYGMNLDYLPGAMLADQLFSPLFLDWNEIDLTTPVPITGEDIWIGFWVNQTEAETYPIGVDEGPANPNGDWFSAGPGWGHLSGDYNWNLQGVLTGDPIEGWLSTDITEGTLVAGDMDNIEVMFDATNLVIGDYYADLVIVSNDPENNFLEIPVHLSVVDGIGIGEGDNSRIEMLVYPNPASNAVNVQANLTIDRLTIYNHIGQTVSEVISDETSVRVNTEAFEAGVYFIRIETANGYTTQKLVIE